MTEILMTIDSIRLSQGNENQRVVVLKEKDTKRCLLIWMGIGESDAIAVILAGVATPRPLTHDFYREIINALGGELKKVVIKEIQDNVYYANATICANNNIIEFDCRPSDALALAVRLNAPIFVNKEVLDQDGLFLTEEDQLEYYGLSEADFKNDK
jgi:uncharacterized protein